MSHFFVSCNLDFETELKKELAEICPFLVGADARPSLEPVKILEEEAGGLLIEAPWAVGLQINFFSKIANRVLWRLKSARIKHFSKLFNECRDLELENILSGQPLALRVSAAKSKLNHEGRIEEVINESLTKLGLRLHRESTQVLQVRIFDDLCEFSLDSSGEHLHLRGYRAQQGEAPLRETIAAFCVRQMLAGSSLAKLDSLEWVDPMCGSGTLLFEASQIYEANRSRRFAFQDWKTCPKIMRTEAVFGNYLKAPHMNWSFVGSDQHPEMVKKAQGNASCLLTKISFQKNDFWQTAMPAVPRRWMILNPPWGERLKSGSSVENSPENIVRRGLNEWGCEKVGILLPIELAKVLAQKIKPSRSSCIFPNGGLKLQFLQFYT